jgi:hypothetical protein
VSLVVGGPAGSPRAALSSRAGGGISAPVDAPLTRGELYWRAEMTHPVIYAHRWMRERVWLTRLRWRLRGATMWPAFLVALVFDAVLLHWLPISGDVAPDLFAAVLLAFFFNLVAVAVGAPLLGRLVRRRWPGLPKVVADDRAGTALVAATAAVLLGLGLAHRPAVQRQQDAFDAQAAAARTFVLARAPARFRAHVDRMDTWKQGAGLYRTCVPGPNDRRSFCVFVNTRHDPPLVIGDRDQSPNSVLAGPDNPGRQAR